MEFRRRNYTVERQSQALPRSLAAHHPLSPPPPPPPPFPPISSVDNQVVAVTNDTDGSHDFFDPLRAPDSDLAVSIEESPEDNARSTSSATGANSDQLPSREWTSFKRFLMQKFPVSKMISVSSAASDVIIKRTKVVDQSSKSAQLENLEDQRKMAEEQAKVITPKEYVSRLHELTDEINRAWKAEDRVTALRLSIKVAKLLTDTSVLQFYPTLFVLVTEVMDMLGDMVWERIKRKAEFAEEGTRICSLAENFRASDVCSDAKETCNNWFCKVGAVKELLPRIYLELAILPCWRFLLDQPEDCLQRLVLMARGLGDPLASAYCRLYMVHCARKLPASDKGYLVSCVNDIKTILMCLLSAKETIQHGHFTDKKRLLIGLMEPSIEYLMKCIFEDASQSQVNAVLVDLGLGSNQVDSFGSSQCVSIVLHSLLKELPTKVVSSNAVDILRLIKYSSDSSFDQCLNYRLLGFRLCESRSEMDILNSVVHEVIQVISQYDVLDEYLKVADAYIDIVLQNQMDNCLTTILEGIPQRACNKGIVEDGLVSLQSILIKLLSHCNNLDEVFTLNHFLEIVDMMHGSARNGIDTYILNMATRNGYIQDPTTIQFLFEISQSLHDGIDFSNMKDDDNQQPARLICHFIQTVDYGAEMERHLMFLIDCRGAFSRINELKETLIHSSNYLAAKALKDGREHLTFVKSCIAFSEVTIPSISAQVRQLNLYLETAEVTLLGGLVSHSDGLIVSALSCLESIPLTDGSQTPSDIDGILASVKKLCSLLVMVPANSARAAAKVPERIFSLGKSQSWMTPRIATRMDCAIILLLATLSQNKLPYHAWHLENLGNDFLFFGDSTYVDELVSLSESVLQNLVSSVELEPSKAARGIMALEACNCIASSFEVSQDLLEVCWKLIETARSCSSANDRYLQSTIKYLDDQLPASISRVVTSVAV